MTERVEEIIRDGVRRLTEHADFVAWKDAEQPAVGDILLINNSFVFRDVKTTKAEEYLCLLVEDPGADPSIGIAVGTRMNLDFKRVAAASTNPPLLTPLKFAIAPQLESLGHLVFLLIGEILDTEVVETKINHEAFQAVVWDPTISADASVESDRIVVKHTNDEDLIWNLVAEHLVSQGDEAPASLRDALGVALDKLQEQAVARVIIPAVGEQSQFGITDAILAVLQEQRDQYANAVSRCAAGGADSEAAANDVLRISYNFASDATGFLRLIVSVCDLKPIVLWGTIAEHYALSAAFQAMPWSRSKNKASLSNYQQTVADARNSAFHNLFPFRKSLRIALPEAALGAPQLQIFSEHGKRSENQLTYQDKELVEVLVQFTRARERSLPLTFWQKNLNLMNATISLFERTNEFIKALAASRA